MKNDKLIQKLLSDNQSGLKTDETGRRYFKQRRVTFRTIRIDEQEIHSSSLPGYDRPLPFLDWIERDPSAVEIRDFAVEASRRFLDFWYKVVDVGIARALSGRDREIYRVDFYRPSVYMDTGIPENQRRSSVHPSLHKRIIEQYLKSLDYRSPYRIFYISTYMEGLTDDVRHVLKPYEKLWDLRARRTDERKKLEMQLIEFESIFLSPSLPGLITVAKLIQSHLESESLKAIRYIVEKQMAKQIESADLRNASHRFRISGEIPDVRQIIPEITKNPGRYGLSSGFTTEYRLLSIPALLRSEARQAAMYLSMIHRLDLRIARLKQLTKTGEGDAATGPHEEKKRRYQERLKKVLDKIKWILQTPEFKKEIEEFISMALSLREWITENKIRNQGNTHNYPEQFDTSGFHDEARNIYEQAGRILDTLMCIRSLERDIVNLYNNPGEISVKDSSPTQETSTFHTDTRNDKSFKYDPPGPLIPDKTVPGNPYDEQWIIDHVRRILYRRLRPIRMTAETYSTIAGHRHGAIPLNPVMKLWKSKPISTEEGLPRIAQKELNGPEQIHLLIDLAGLVHRNLDTLKLEWRGIVAEQRPNDSLSSVKFFLVPGSCFPLRDIERQDFPEFRNRVIGESRKPHELGVAADENSILTGAWYNKRNHSLYYPVGGDNGSLIRIIYRGGRFDGPPAFFFALGQFVHDTLPENLTYYKTGTTTFRHCVEDFYRAEDRTRRNRGELTGRKRVDNSREGVRFMFAVFYSRFLMEVLTGSMQFTFRHRPTEKWMAENLGIPVLPLSDRSSIRNIRNSVLQRIENSANGESI